MKNTIKIDPYDKHFDVVSWVEQEKDARQIANQHYIQAVLFDDPVQKIAFFDAYKRAEDINKAISDYFASPSDGTYEVTL